MARRGTQTEEKPETGAETPIEQLAEGQVETTEPDTETPEAPAAEAEAKPEVDLTSFQEAAAKAVSERDESTGDVPQASIDEVNKVYREIDGVKGKNQARAWIDDQMKAAIMGKEIMEARAYVTLKDGLSAGSSSGPKAPADPTTAFVHKVAALVIADTLVRGNVPEGVDEGWEAKVDELVTSLSEQVDAYAAWDASEDEDAEQPDTSPVVRQAFKLAAGRGGGGGGSRVSGGPRNNIENHLKEVFADKEVGAFLTINEIAKAKSTEYGDLSPSAGAVSARLFPKGKDPYNANGIEAVNEEGKPRGARKTA